MVRRRTTLVAGVGLALVLAGAPAAALDPVSTAIVIGAVTNLGVAALDKGLPALQADRQRDQYILETVEFLQQGQIVIQQGQVELAHKLDELGDRVPRELRAELDELVENQVTGVANLLISDVKRVADGGNPLISPEIRLNEMQTAIGTYMQRRSADVGLGVPGWGLTVELAFIEARRGALINEYERSTGRQLDSIKESYHSRVNFYLAHFARAFDPGEPRSVRARLDREQTALGAALQTLNDASPKLDAATKELPRPDILDNKTGVSFPSMYTNCVFSGADRVVNFLKSHRFLRSYLANDSLASEFRNVTNNAIAPAQHHAKMSRLLASELERARRLFEGLRTVQLEAERVPGRTVGLGIRDEALEALRLPATLGDNAIKQTITRARTAVEAARTAQDALGDRRRKKAVKQARLGDGWACVNRL